MNLRNLVARIFREDDEKEQSVKTVDSQGLTRSAKSMNSDWNKVVTDQ